MLMEVRSGEVRSLRRLSVTSASSLRVRERLGGMLRVVAVWSMSRGRPACLRVAVRSNKRSLRDWTSER